MFQLSFLGSTAFLLCLFLNLAIKNTSSKYCETVVPRVGGVPVAAAYIFAVCLVLLASARPGYANWLSAPVAIRLLPAFSLTIVLGLLYDLGIIEPWHKGIGEIAAACLVFWAGVRIYGLDGADLRGWSLPLTIVWILTCSAAIKWIDESGGTGAGIGLLAALTFIIDALIQRNSSLAVVAVGLGASLCGYLVCGFGAFKLRFGETGSLFVGVLIGCCGILGVQSSTSIASKTAPLLVLSLPLIDMAFGMFRRFLLRRPILEGDTRYVYYRPPRRGLSANGWALASYFTCTIGAICFLLIVTGHGPRILMMMFCICLSIYVVGPNYGETAVAWRLLRKGAFHDAIVAQIELHPLEIRLEEATTPTEWWKAVEERLVDFGFLRAQMSVAGLVFEWRQDLQVPRTWEVEIPIGDSDFVRLSRAFGANAAGDAFAPFASLLRRSISTKRSMFYEPNSSKPHRN